MQDLAKSSKKQAKSRPQRDHNEGLVKLSANSLDVTELGRILVRTIAAVFDRYWTPGLSSTV
jgi:coproporphyrinogen III oxidase-like Fe-S oxidoreductase